MSITASEMSPADIRACTEGNSGGGGGWGNGMWGDWIILFLLLALLGYGGGYGFGGGFGGGGGGAGFQGIATRADINEGFALNNITGGIQAIQQGICDYTYALTNTITNGFHNTERGLWDVSRQIGDCCCQTQRSIDGVNYNIAKGFCDIGNVIQNTTRDVIENNNANSRAILDFLTQDKIATLTAENQTLRFQASQSAQNAFITANQEAQTATLLRRLGADCPTPAYLVNAPTPVSFPVNSCGQVQFGNYGGNCGCGCGCG